MFQIALASRVAEWDSTEKIGDLFVASVSVRACACLWCVRGANRNETVLYTCVCVYVHSLFVSKMQSKSCVLSRGTHIVFTISG